MTATLTRERVHAVLGDRVFRWVWVGLGEQHDLQPLTVVRVNRKTITVRTDHGATIRLPPGLIAGRYYEWEK